MVNDSLSDALSRHHPRPFSRLYVNMVRAGEKGGVLEVTLRRLAEFLEARAAFRDATARASGLLSDAHTSALGE